MKWEVVSNFCNCHVMGLILGHAQHSKLCSKMECNHFLSLHVSLLRMHLNVSSRLLRCDAWLQNIWLFHLDVDMLVVVGYLTFVHLVHSVDGIWRHLKRLLSDTLRPALKQMEHWALCILTGSENVILDTFVDLSQLLGETFCVDGLCWISIADAKWDLVSWFWQDKKKLVREWFQSF